MRILTLALLIAPALSLAAAEEAPGSPPGGDAPVEAAVPVSAPDGTAPDEPAPASDAPAAIPEPPKNAAPADATAPAESPQVAAPSDATASHGATKDEPGETTASAAPKQDLVPPPAAVAVSPGPAPNAPALGAHAKPAAAPVAPIHPKERLPRVGFRLDAGVPDGAGLALMYRIIPSLRASLGGTWNYLGWGANVGLGWTPLRWYVTPSLNVEGGYYFDSDLSWAVDGSPDLAGLRPMLKRFGYTYGTAQLGLELGSKAGSCFFVRAGLTYVDLTLRGKGEITEGSGADEVTYRFSNPHIRGTGPSVKLGFLIWF